MKYLAILGRQPEISLAELTALFSNVKKISNSLATFSSDNTPDIARLGGSIKIAEELSEKPLEYLQKIPDGKITLGLSDYSKNASARSAKTEALKLKQILVRHGRSVRVVESKTAALPTATSLHNGLSGKNERKCELIKTDFGYFRVIGIQDIDAYTKRDQARPARDAKVGMLPPKLAQILINLCGPLPEGSRILDPFCGTGVVLQEALLMGYTAYGTDLSDRMVEYTTRNLNWLSSERATLAPVVTGLAAQAPRWSQRSSDSQFQVSVGDATSFQWDQPIDAVACEGYLGSPMSQVPPEIKLKDQKHECEAIILGFLKNLSGQIKSDTPVVIAAPAWLRPDGTYERLDIFDHSRRPNEEKHSFSSEATKNGQSFTKEKIDEIENMGYNVKDISREGLLYHRDDQIVARDIIILRKK